MGRKRGGVGEGKRKGRERGGVGEGKRERRGVEWEVGREREEWRTF